MSADLHGVIIYTNARTLPSSECHSGALARHYFQNVEGGVVYLHRGTCSARLKSNIVGNITGLGLGTKCF